MTLAEKIKGVLEKVNIVQPIKFREACCMDFSKKNKDLDMVNIENTHLFSKWVFDYIKKNNCDTGVGGYLEDRVIYKRSSLFSGRTIHLGVDIWVPEGTEIRAPMDCMVHSFQNNNAFGDYGATLILEHDFFGIIFWTLYGHLDKASITHKKIGQRFKAGDVIAHVGGVLENGSWPSHLHFQIIGDLLGNKGDFPGVCTKNETDNFMKICPDPMIIITPKGVVTSVLPSFGTSPF